MGTKFSYEKRLQLRKRISTDFQHVLSVILISIKKKYCDIKQRLPRRYFPYHPSLVLQDSQAEELSYVLDWVFETFHIAGEVNLISPLPKLLLICGRTAKAINIYDILT